MTTEERLSPDDLARLLSGTSRTFALAIALLEGALARQIGASYLLLRIADTLEDAPLWGGALRARALASFVHWLDERGLDERGGLAVEWRELARERPPTDDEACLELLARAGDVRDAVRAMPASVAHAILHHTRRTALGMGAFVARQDERGAIALDDLDDLRRYAYAVAGIVGELLTDLFALAHAGIAALRPQLDASAAAFGEGLQLVNILKDEPTDAREGRAYLPRGVPREAVVALAREDLARARAYMGALRDANAPRGVLAFCELPVRLAEATLDRLDEGSPKLAREEVMGIYATVTSMTPRI